MIPLEQTQKQKACVGTKGISLYRSRELKLMEEEQIKAVEESIKGESM